MDELFICIQGVRVPADQDLEEPEPDQPEEGARLPGRPSLQL